MFLAVYPNTMQIVDTDVDRATLIGRASALVAADGRTIEILQQVKRVQLKTVAKPPVEVVDIP